MMNIRSQKLSLRENVIFLSFVLFSFDLGTFSKSYKSTRGKFIFFPNTDILIYNNNMSNIEQLFSCRNIYLGFIISIHYSLLWFKLLCLLDLLDCCHLKHLSSCKDKIMTSLKWISMLLKNPSLYNMLNLKTVLNRTHDDGLNEKDDSWFI